jgi:hypothetical protein
MSGDPPTGRDAPLMVIGDGTNEIQLRFIGVRPMKRR